MLLQLDSWNIVNVFLVVVLVNESVEEICLQQKHLLLVQGVHVLDVSRVWFLWETLSFMIVLLQTRSLILGGRRKETRPGSIKIERL